MTDQTLLSDLKRLPGAWSDAAAERGLESFLSCAAKAPEHHDEAMAVVEDPKVSPLLRAIFGNSPYLTQTIIRDLPFFLGLLHPPCANLPLRNAATGTCGHDAPAATD